MQQNAMHRYQAFGLEIRSEVPLPGLPHATAVGSDDPSGGTASARVEVCYGAVPYSPGERPPPHPLVVNRDGDVIFYWNIVGAVRIQGGTRITVDALPSRGEDAIGQAVQGVGLGTLLYQRGVFTLHASAVSIEGAVAGFIGVKGAGKSTTAAALHARGHPLVTDDILAVEMLDDRSRARVLTGTVALKLWPEAAAASLGDDPTDLDEVYRNSIKRHRPTIPAPTGAPLALACIYLLDFADSDQPRFRVEALPPQLGCLHYIQHSYAQRMLGQQALHGEHLQQCARLARIVPVRHLTRRRELDALDGLARKIERDVLQLWREPLHE
jgi:hypothetical protein